MFRTALTLQVSFELANRLNKTRVQFKLKYSFQELPGLSRLCLLIRYQGFPLDLQSALQHLSDPQLNWIPLWRGQIPLVFASISTNKRCKNNRYFDKSIFLKEIPKIWRLIGFAKVCSCKVQHLLIMEILKIKIKIKNQKIFFLTFWQLGYWYSFSMSLKVII